MTPETQRPNLASPGSQSCSQTIETCPQQVSLIKSVWYVTMAFPVPSEAFASVEINELCRREIEIFVKTIRNKRADNEQVMAQQQVQNVPVEHADWASPIRGLLVAVKRPLLAMRLWWKLFTSLASRPTVLLACLFWSLRCFELFDQVRREKPDVVHLYWGHVPSILGWLVLESELTTTVTTSLGAYDLELALPIGFEVARRSAGVRTWADPNVIDIESHNVPREQISILFKGISLSAFESDSQVLGIERPNQLLFAGRLIPQKGITLLLDVFHRVHSRFPGTKLSILGDGHLRASLESRVNELCLSSAVEFCGHVSHSELIRELQRCSIFLLPSTLPSERLPNVIKEAAAAGCCCLTTATPGIDALIRDKESGRILPADDVDAWVTAVTEMLNNPNLAHRMAEVAKQNVHEHFDIERTTDQLIAWWDRLIVASSGQRRAEL